MAGWALAAEQGQEPCEGARGSISGLEMGTRKEPCARLSHPVLPPHSSLLSLLPNVFLRGSPLGPSVLCFETLALAGPPAGPCPHSCCSGASRAGTAQHGRARQGCHFPHTVLTPICSVCLIQPLCPCSVSHPACPPQHSPSQAISHPSSLSCPNGLQLDHGCECALQVSAALQAPHLPVSSQVFMGF